MRLRVQEGLWTEQQRPKAKKERKVYIDAIIAKRREILKEQADRICKEVREKVRALKTVGHVSNRNA